MSNVVGIDTITTLPLTAERVLTGALAADMDCCIVIGSSANGPYHASTTADIPEMIFRLEMFKRQLLERAANGT